MRIALARLLMSAPDVLLLDEPSNHLDLASLDWLERELSRYEGTVITVSHDRFFLDRNVTQIADLRPNGVRLYPGGYEEFVRLRDEELELLEKEDLLKWWDKYIISDASRLDIRVNCSGAESTDLASLKKASNFEKAGLLK